jgi:predicted small metal-binding protein
MKEFSCGDVVPGCKAHFRARSDEDLLNQVAAHARDGHGIHEVSTELAAKVKQHIHAVNDG